MVDCWKYIMDKETHPPSDTPVAKMGVPGYNELIDSTTHSRSSVFVAEYSRGVLRGNPPVPRWLNTTGRYPFDSPSCTKWRI